MKASELIKELEKFIEISGDCRVYIINMSDYGHHTEIINPKLVESVSIFKQEQRDRCHEIKEISIVLNGEAEDD